MEFPTLAVEHVVGIQWKKIFVVVSTVRLDSCKVHQCSTELYQLNCMTDGFKVYKHALIYDDV